MLLDARGEDEEAERWLRRGAEAGDPHAALALGHLLERSDAGEAAAWYRRALTAGGEGADKAQQRLAALEG